MPLVIVLRNPRRVDHNLVKSFADELPKIVSDALTTKCSQGQLTADEVEVWIRDAKLLDVNTRDLEIIIWAGDYPERRVNLAERREKIVSGVKKIINSSFKSSAIHGFVWVLLNPSSFEEFVITQVPPDA